ncbi:hypothetical protein [Actinoplanes sp. OR16]|uniref:hypothetical protein n=1 Tax=Actinoplanes sp. OR16 TaxID=946334 RepID=UPI001576F98A|nr:hypothetical protein [Actinoplanes sp. OR16]
MSDVNPEAFAEFTTQDGPGSADIDEERPAPGEPSVAATSEERNADESAEEFPGERDL